MTEPEFKRWTLALSCLPLVHYLFVVLFWLIGSVVLGRWVQPGIDDPKDFAHGVPLMISIALLVASIAVAPLVIFLGVVQRRLATHAALYSLSLIISVVLFRIDILKITTWIAD